MTSRRGSSATLVALLVGAPALVLGAPPRKPPAPRPAASASASSAPASASAPLPELPPPPSASAPAPAPSAPEVETILDDEPPSEREEGEAAMLWPTATPAGDGDPGGPLRAPGLKDGALVERARELDRVLTEAAQDLGLRLDVGARGPALPRVVRDGDLLDEARERKAWVISPRIERDGGEVIVRIVAVPPEAKVALVGEERVPAARLSVRGVVMLRDLLRARRSGAKASVTPPPREEGAEPRASSGTSGRGVLAATLTIFGGYAGYALYKSGRGSDPRLLYPLMAIGTGVGLGAAVIAADEWEPGLGDAWFLSAGALWPTTSALLLSEGYEVKPSTDAHAFALVAGIGGLGLAAARNHGRSVSEGGALLTHSSAAFGTFLGGLGEMMVQGSTDFTPYRGAGYGAAGGWVVGGLLGPWLNPSASRMLRLDLGAGLGALAGAALGSPLLLDDPSKNRERLWLGAVMVGTVAGGAVGVWLAGPVKNEAVRKAVRLLPAPAVVATAPGVGGEKRPVMGLAWSGIW